MLPNGDYDKMEPFMEHTKLANAIDMEMGPDGKIYLLEYGTGWFQKNPDAGLSRIDYIAGNRAPKIAKVSVDKNTGALPFKIKITTDAIDPEKDKMTYTWTTGDGTVKETSTPELEHTYTKTGDFSISVEVKDNNGASTKSETLQVYAGNTTPAVNINIGGNKTFYFPGMQVLYSITASDKEDTAISAGNLFISADYIEGTDLASVAQGHQQGEAGISGRNLVQSLDCKTCHKETEKNIGPAYTDVAKKYQKDPNAKSYLTEKIIKGGGGVWGETAMAAHPSLPASDISQIVDWIMSLAGEQQVKKSLPQNGSLQPSLGNPVKDNGVLKISASYTDLGGNNIKSLTGRSTTLLRNSKVLFSGKEKMKGYTTINFNGQNFMIAPAATGWFTLDNIDMTGIGSAIIAAGWQQAPAYGFDFELRLDDEAGKLIGTGSVLPPKEKSKPGAIGFGMASFAIEAVTDGKLHTIYIVSKPKDSKESTQIFLQSIQFNPK
jgi:cytochrome c551/c552